MMIKCQKCGFENQMGSIFCRECGEKLDMDAIDPNKLQKDVNKEKNIKLAKKRVKSAISASISVLIVAGFIFAVIYRGWADNKDYSVVEVEETASEASAAAQKKFDAVMRGTTVGTVKYTYPEINYMFRDQVVKPLYEVDSFAKIVSFEMGFSEEKNLPMANIWIKIKDKVPVRYVIYGDFFHKTPNPEDKNADEPPIGVDVRRLDIGLIPLFFSTQTFLDGLMPLVDNEAMRNFFRNAKTVEFNGEGMSVEFAKGSAAPANSMAPSSSGKPSASAGVAALKGGSTAALSEKDEAAREAARQKAEEEKEKKRQQAEERKRKQEEEAERKRQKEEERKQKIEEEKERKRQQEEERKRKIEEENQRRREEADRRREEAEQRRRDRENDRYNNRNNRNSRNNRW